MPAPDTSTAPAPWTIARWLVPVMLFVGVFGVFAATAGYQNTHIDAHAAMVESWHIASTGSPWLEGDLDAQMESNKFIGEADNGHVVGLRMAGPVLAGVPAYWLLDRDPDPDAFTFTPGALTASLLTALAVTLLFLSMRPYLPSTLSIVAALAFAFATPTWTVSADALWTHPITQLGIAGGAFGASRGRWWLAGSFFAIGMLGRPHVALIAAMVGLGAGWAARSLRPVVAVAVPTLLSLTLLTLWSRWMFGAWSVGGAYAGRAESAVSGFEGSAEWDGRFPQLTNYLGFLVSFDRGLLVWTPAVLVFLPAIIRSWGRIPSWSRWLLLGGVVYSFVQLRLNYFPGGDGFWGYRHALELITCLVPAMAFASPYLGRVGRAVLPPVLAAQFAVMSVGAVVTGYSVLIDDVWTDNGFWMALRSQPLVLGTWLGVCVVAGVVVSGLLARRDPPRAPAGAAYGQHSNSVG